jgi:hypothetical protein
VEGARGPPSTRLATSLLWTHRLLPRLVLPYVRHLKGEDDKPLPPSKPRKQYKMAKESRGDDGATERPKKAKEERQVDQVSTKHSGVALSPAFHSSLFQPSYLPDSGCPVPCWEYIEPTVRAGLDLLGLWVL